ncbi:MAG: hypothetical protein IJH37_02825 [Clostridia bacterium]|nr:hypothetical protein [Clostridia bacterium]
MAARLTPLAAADEYCLLNLTASGNKGVIMRIVKHIIWLILLTVIQTVFGRLIAVYGTVPNLLAGYSIIIAFCAKDDKEAAYVLFGAALLSGSCVGHLFAADVFFIGIGSAAARVAVEYFRFVSAPVRISAVTALTAAAIAVVECFAAHHTIDAGAILHIVLPFVLYTTAAACVLYPIVMKTMYKKTEKKLIVL